MSAVSRQQRGVGQRRGGDLGVEHLQRGYPVAAVNNNERAGVNPGNGGTGTMRRPMLAGFGADRFNGSKTIDRVVVYSLQDNYPSPVEPTDTQTFSLYGIKDFTVEGAMAATG